MLAELQRNFCVYLADDEKSVVPDVAASAQRGLPVYHHAFRATLTACLRDTFEKTHAWLGDACFDAAARVHVAACPSASWTLAGYGSDFDKTLAALYPEDPEVAELAWLDRALRSAFDGPDGGSLDVATLANVDWDTAVFDVVPTLGFRHIVSNAPAIWSALAADAQPPEAGILETPAILSVWRHDLTPQFSTITALEHRALELAVAGEPFNRICELVSPDAEDAAVAGAMLARWVGEGVVTRVASPTRSE